MSADDHPVLLTEGVLLDGEHPPRRASLLLSGGRVQALLAPGEPVPDGAREMSLGGRLVVPGFCDAHCHFIWAGLLAVRPSLSGAASRAHVLDRLRASLERSDLPEAVLAEGWDESEWPESDGALTRADLDAISRERPIVARRACTHRAVANSAALRYFKDSPHVDPERGTLLEEAAMSAAEALPGLEGERERAVDAALGEAHRLGIVEVHEFGILPGDLTLLRQRSREGTLPLRVRFFARYPLWRAASEDLLRAPGDGDRFRVAGVKFFADGSIGARTAALTSPYLDGGRGQLLWQADGLAGALREAHERGWPAAIHAIGDDAVRVVLDALESAGVAGDRIEHLELASERDLDRVARLGVTASMQPNFVARWAREGGLYDRALGPRRAAGSNAFASLRRRGVRLAFGSDSMPLGPIFGLRGALRHRDRGESLGVGEAVGAYTSGGPRSLGEERGSLIPGTPADLCVLDVRSDHVDSLVEARVHQTWVAGRLVHEREREHEHA